jgi:hypothetical protein
MSAFGVPHIASTVHDPGAANANGGTVQIRLDDGSIVPDVAYFTSAQLGRPFKVTWIEVPERDAIAITGPWQRYLG